MLDKFTFVATSEDVPGKIRSGYNICKKCGQRVETGIVTMADHWSKCYKDEYDEIQGTLDIVFKNNNPSGNMLDETTQQ